MSDFAFRPAAALAAMIAARTISARELLDDYAARIETHNPALNAIVEQDLDAARARAERADAMTARGESLGPLHGLPMTLKDSFPVAGLVSTGGDPGLKAHRPDADGAAVHRLRAAGANILGKTNVPLYSGDWQTHNEIHGLTRNPWDLERTPGGSSGGAAAALAAGLIAADIGSDIGGSIRMPAHFCGLFGHKPSYGATPLHGHIPPGPESLAPPDLSVAGPLGRSAADLALLFAVLAGRPDDAQFPRPPFRPRPVFGAGDLRLAVWLDEPGVPTSRAASEAVRAAAGALEAEGATLDYEARPAFGFRDNYNDYVTLLVAILSRGFPQRVLERFTANAGKIKPDDESYEALQTRGATMTYRQAEALEARRFRIKQAWGSFFEDYDALLCPVACTTAFAHSHTVPLSKRTLMVDGRKKPYLDLLMWPSLATHAHLPASVAPSILDADGLPAGVQIIGPFLGDRTTIAIARLLENHHKGFTPPPGFA